MSKQAKTIIEYRNYELPENFPILLLTGDRWHISDIKSGRLHFHNCRALPLRKWIYGIRRYAIFFPGR